MKLNNKGFAVTTVLYGVLTIMIVVLSLVLGTIRTRRVINTKLVSTVEDKLNKCLDYEMVYEACYLKYGNYYSSSYNFQVDGSNMCYSTEYLACIGAQEGSYTAPIGKYPEALLASVKSSGDTNIIEDPTELGRYIYQGSSPKNYVKFNNSVGRIVSFEQDGTMKVVFYNLDGDISWDNSVGYNNPYVSSNIVNTLNVAYINQFLYTTKIINKNNWRVGSVYSHNTFEEVVDRQQLSVWKGYFGLLSLSDYIMASSSCALSDSLSDFNCSSSNNWLNNNSDFWLLTEDASNTTKVYYINNGTITSTNKNNIYKVYPVVFFKNNVVISDGLGTSDNPYIIEI